jgi:hypothetical protein
MGRRLHVLNLVWWMSLLFGHGAIGELATGSFFLSVINCDRYFVFMTATTEI